MDDCTGTGERTLPESARQNTPLWLASAYPRIRQLSEQLCAPLQPEDMSLQACPDVSPPRWHLAHTTWFFETFLLVPHLPGYQPFNPAFEYLFNSYYNGIGEQYPRPQRHLLSRPTNEEVLAWRRQVDDAMLRLIDTAPQLASLIELGLNHEQQHQELLLTDIKYSLSFNPLSPAISMPIHAGNDSLPALSFQDFTGGKVAHGAAPSEGFVFDNETPRHPVWLAPYRLANRPVTNGEYRDFINDGGYQRPELWLSDGWAWVQQHSIQRPLYWQGDLLNHWTLAGMQPLLPDQILAHVNYYEADAYARWAGARLPTEFEWEIAAGSLGTERGALLDPDRCHPGRVGAAMIGDVWEWTASAYLPYPGFVPANGAVGEYNGKFMSDQHVLRGASAVTPVGHERLTYRNFFPAPSRWVFSGLRLAR